MLQKRFCKQIACFVFCEKWCGISLLTTFIWRITCNDLCNANKYCAVSFRLGFSSSDLCIPTLNYSDYRIIILASKGVHYLGWPLQFKESLVTIFVMRTNIVPCLLEEGYAQLTCVFHSWFIRIVTIFFVLAVCILGSSVLNVCVCLCTYLCMYYGYLPINRRCLLNHLW